MLKKIICPFKYIKQKIAQIWSSFVSQKYTKLSNPGPYCINSCSLLQPCNIQEQQKTTPVPDFLNHTKKKEPYFTLLEKFCHNVHILHSIMCTWLFKIIIKPIYGFRTIHLIASICCQE